MTTPPPSPALTQQEFEDWIQTIRPELHRYATRMTGSVIDGDDVVQEALVKAYASLPLLTHQTNLRGWMFRITHNKAIDLLRRDSKAPLELLDEYPMTETPDQPLESRELSALALSMFLKLAPRQRSCVILKDVMGYSLAEISELLDATVPEIKATLHRGRTKLRELSQDGESAAPQLDAHERELLNRYVDRFNARDFDSLRMMLADEVRLELVGRTKLKGAAAIADNYFHKYSETFTWRYVAALVEDRPAIVAYDVDQQSTEPVFFILLTWEDGLVADIHDFHYARYLMQDVAINPL
ncbi:MAG: sigma-70 family RNA polymerase sigma factor [Chloroflexota bacterium]